MSEDRVPTIGKQVPSTNSTSAVEAAVAEEVVAVHTEVARHEDEDNDDVDDDGDAGARAWEDGQIPAAVSVPKA